MSARLYKITKENDSLDISFGKISKEEKQEFFRDHQGFMGEDLLKALKSFLQLSLTEEKVDGFAATGKFIDEADLDEKYANKPDQLANIKQRARKFFHPDRQVTLYEDLDFNSTAAVSSKRKQEQQVEGEVNEKLKKQKR